jgi:poly(beta-D-mannuronate) lyase
VAGLAVAWYQGNTRRASFDVQTSGNGTSGTTQFSGMSRGSTTQPEPVDFEDVSARSVRIVGHGNTLHRWDSMTEVDVYGP